VTRAELVELLTVERFAPWQPPTPASQPERARPRRPARPGPPARPSGPLLVALDDPATIARRVEALLAIDDDARHGEAS